MEARPIAEDEQEAFEELAQAHGSLFLRREWSRLFGKKLTKVGLFGNEGRLEGGFQIFREQRFGLSVIRNAPYTPDMGPFLRVRTQHPVATLEAWRDGLAAMAKYLRRRHVPLTYLSLSQRVSDGLPYLWNGFKVSPSYTYVLDLTRDWNALERGLTSTRRNHLARARRDGLEARRVEAGPVLQRLVLGSFANAGGDAKPEFLERILLAYATPTNSFALAAYVGDEPLACVFVVHDGHTAFSLLAGTQRASGFPGAGVLAFWEAIREAKAIGCKNFDLEGSTIPSVERYLRPFGGTLVPYLTVSRGWLAVEVALKVRYRQLF